MTHAATLEKLAEGLLSSLTGLKPEDVVFRGLRNRTVRGIRNQSHARTNQFAVQKRLDGLTEKLSVLNRDDLSDALQRHLEELSGRSAYLPEVLSLLLELSERPAEAPCNSALGDPAQDELASRLTWEDIVAEEPFDEPGVWDDIDRHSHSSADDSSQTSEPEDPTETISTIATSVYDEGDDLARLHLVQPDAGLLAAIESSTQKWTQSRARQPPLVISELALVREMLSMFRGLPTNLFAQDRASGRVVLVAKAKLGSLSISTTMDVLQHCVKTGSALNFLRSWVKTEQTLPYLRSIQASIGALLTCLDSELVCIEDIYVTPRVSDSVVSIIDAHSAVRALASPFVHLSSIMQIFSLSANGHGHLGLLDTLYDEACLAQVAGNWDSFLPLTKVFLAGLKAYLRPIAAWITTGTPAHSNQGATFVEDVDPHCEDGRLWSDRFAKKVGPDGDVVVPKCMLPMADMIFALGKSNALLRRLNAQRNESSQEDRTRPMVSAIEDILDRMHSDSLLSLPQLLEFEIRAWISEISTDCAPQLRIMLWRGFGLSQTMDMLPYIYFSKDATMFHALAEDIASHLPGPRNHCAWNSQFLATELVQSTLAAVPGIEVSSIKVTLPFDQTTIAAMSVTRKLGLCTLEYAFTWPVQNITSCKYSTTHAKVFAFLLQVHHARRLLERGFFDLRSRYSRPSPVLSLRHKLLWFVGILQHFIATTANVLHGESYHQLAVANDVDSMIALWAAYDKRLQTSLLLSPRLEPVRDTITSVLELSELLVNSVQVENITAMESQFDKSRDFLVMSIQRLGRAGGFPALEMLADRLV
jgi:gamma-tubulin complex component 5